ncbi:MAG: hypothetical protein Kow0069_13370 [Promethearchaeota archaeon]
MKHERKTNPELLRIGYLGSLYHSSHVIRYNRWVEESLGLDVQWHRCDTGPEMMALFERGLLDVGYIGLPPAIIGMDRGVPIRCVAGGHVNGTVFLASQEYSTVEELGSVGEVLRQFVGKKIGTPARGSIHDIILRCHLERAGLTGKVQVVNYAVPDEVPYDICRGELAAGVGTPAMFTVYYWFYNRLGHLIVPPEVPWPDNPSYGLVAHEDLLESDVLRGFLELHVKASKYLREKLDEVVALAQAEYKVVSARILRHAFEVSPHYCAQLTREYVNSTLLFVPVMERLKYLSGRLVGTTPEQAESLIFAPDLIHEVHPPGDHYRTSCVKDVTENGTAGGVAKD